MQLFYGSGGLRAFLHFFVLALITEQYSGLRFEVPEMRLIRQEWAGRASVGRPGLV